MSELAVNIRFGDNFTGDKKVYTRIIKHILIDKGWKFGDMGSSDGNPIHIGDNKFEFDIIEYDGIMAGSGGRYLFWIDEYDRVQVKKDIRWMS